jgi:hypothetical protein
MSGFISPFSDGSPKGNLDYLAEFEWNSFDSELFLSREPFKRAFLEGRMMGLRAIWIWRRDRYGVSP